MYKRSSAMHFISFISSFSNRLCDVYKPMLPESAHLLGRARVNRGLRVYLPDAYAAGAMFDCFLCPITSWREMPAFCLQLKSMVFFTVGFLNDCALKIQHAVGARSVHVSCHRYAHLVPLWMGIGTVWYPY